MMRMALLSSFSRRVTTAVKVYDPARRAFSAFAPLLAARWGHTADLLADGTVLVLGAYEQGAPTSEIVSLPPSR